MTIKPPETSRMHPMDLPAIDIHAHLGVYAGQHDPLRRQLAGVPTETILARARRCGIAWTVASHLGAFDPGPGRPSDVAAANEAARREAEFHEGLLFWAVLNPRTEGWAEQTARLLAHERCAGVKLHPRWHFWAVEAFGEAVFAFLHEHQALALTHSGNADNEPERFIPFANRYSRARLILAHIGHDQVDGTLDRQLRAVRQAKRGNVWADTSSAKSVTAGLIEYAAETIGAERILFGTDTPLYDSAAQKARIACAAIPEPARRCILFENAAALLGTKVRGTAVVSDS